MTLTMLFVIHNENLKCRIPYINSTLQKIQEIKPDITPHIIKEPSSIPSDTIKIKTKLEKTNIEHFDRMLVNINEGHACNIEKHRNVWKQINTDDEYVWILEDDVVISNEYISNIKEFLSTNLSNLIFDILFTGFSIKGNTKFNKVEHTIIPSKASYIIKGSLAKKLYNYTDIYKYPLRTTISKYLYDNKKTCTALAYQDHLLLEASKIGMIPSSINSNNVLIFNPDYGNLIKILNNENMNIKDAKAIYKKLEHLGSPDINHIMGVIYHKNNIFDQAKEHFIKAIDLLIEKQGYLGKNSDILNNSINIFKYDQSIF